MNEPQKEDGSDDPKFLKWKSLQTISWMMAFPSGKSGYELYKGEMLKDRECALQHFLKKEEEEEKEKGRKRVSKQEKTVYWGLFDDLK